ncbi:MAG TPA: hypothetical protein VFG03_20230 [Telluria sp.]|nr:hypothetical protein [Telluria sp.]
MPISPLPAFRPARSRAAAATVALHLALLGVWQLAKVRPPRDAADSMPPIQWIKLPLPLPLPLPSLPRTREPMLSTHAMDSRLRGNDVPVPAATEPAAITLMPAPTPPSAAAILDQARRDAGKIDRALRKEALNQFHAPADTPMTRLAAGIDAASAAPKPWEAPRVTDEMDQGQYGRRIYKVKGAFGTYCIYNETNHAPDGLDAMKNGLHPKIMSCPREK